MNTTQKHLKHNNNKVIMESNNEINTKLPNVCTQLIYRGLPTLNYQLPPEYSKSSDIILDWYRDQLTCDTINFVRDLAVNSLPIPNIPKTNDWPSFSQPEIRIRAEIDNHQYLYEIFMGNKQIVCERLSMFESQKESKKTDVGFDGVHKEIFIFHLQHRQENSESIEKDKLYLSYKECQKIKDVKQFYNWLKDYSRG